MLSVPHLQLACTYILRYINNTYTYTRQHPGVHAYFDVWNVWTHQHVWMCPHRVYTNRTVYTDIRSGWRYCI